MIFVYMFMMILLTIILIYLMEFWIHRSMVIDHTSNWRYVSFTTFKNEFNKIDWEIWPDFLGSRFGYDYLETEFHAGIIRIKGVGLVIYPWDYWRLTLFRRVLKKIDRKKNLWIIK